MKTIRLQAKGLKAIGYTTLLSCYGKNAKGNYRIELNYPQMPIYSSKKKPIFRNLYILNIILFWVPIVYFPIELVLILILSYIEGLINFLKNRANVTSVRLFNWVNIALIFALIIFKIL